MWPAYGTATCLLDNDTCKKNSRHNCAKVTYDPELREGKLPLISTTTSSVWVLPRSVKMRLIGDQVNTRNLRTIVLCPS